MILQPAVVTDLLTARLPLRATSEGHHGHQELVFDCPFCRGRRKLYFNLRSDLWLCYKCEERGRLRDFIAAIDDIDPAAANHLIYKAHHENQHSMSLDQLKALWDKAITPLETEAEVTPSLPFEFIPVYDEETGRVAMPLYLQERRISVNLAREYGLGFCEGGRYDGRIILPAHVHGTVSYFQARAIDDRQPKYLGPAANRGVALFGFDEAVARGGRTITVVEGPFDVLGCARAGVPAVGLMGKSISQAQVKLLRETWTEVVLLLDPDAADSVLKVKWELVKVGLPVRVGKLHGTDPGASLIAPLREAIAQAT